jgi:enamine deaminase RidA (YjgF/YER057c/UK114 family)
MTNDSAPTVRPPIAAAVRHGDTLIMSGQTAIDGSGRLLAQGRVGHDVSFDEARDCAALCARTLLAVARRLAAEERFELARVLEVRVFVACDADFALHHLVADAATSTLLAELGEDTGLHARTAIGVPSLPGGSPVEVQATFAVTTS